MTRKGSRLRAALVLLLLVSAALFAVGTTVERHQHTEGAPAASETTGHTEGSSEVHPSESHPGAGETVSTSSEDVFGINPESQWIIILGVVLSVLLAVAVWFLVRPIVFAFVIGFGLLFTALDLREMVHQVNEARTSLVIVSLILALLHLAIAGIAGVFLRPRASAQVAA